MKGLLAACTVILLQWTNLVFPAGYSDPYITMQEHECEILSVQAYLMKDVCFEAFGSMLSFHPNGSLLIQQILLPNSTATVCDYYTNETINNSGLNKNSTMTIALCSSVFAFLILNAQNCTGYYTLNYCNMTTLANLYYKFVYNPIGNCRANPSVPGCALEPDSSIGNNCQCLNGCC